MRLLRALRAAKKVSIDHEMNTRNQLMQVQLRPLVRSTDDVRPTRCMVYFCLVPKLCIKVLMVIIQVLIG